MQVDDGSGVYLGLISGTSADGIDAVLVRFAQADQAPVPLHVELILGSTFHYPATLRAQVLALSQHADPVLSLDALGALDTQLGQEFAAAANALIAESAIERSDILAIGSHGQTLRHRPQGEFPFSLQLADANVIAERTGITTVADFRRRDIAAGGQGAPLLPIVHAALLRDASEVRAVLNLGGIGNLTLLPLTGDIAGFDTGPANGLMDAWCERHRGTAFDRNGALARSGEVDAALLHQLLDDWYFSLPPPKSTGRDHFNLDWLDKYLGSTARAPEDVQATLCELSAVSIANALRSAQPDTQRVLVCGGGVHNGFFLDRLRALLPQMHIESTAAHGIDPDFIEAIAFAWLARESIAGRPGNLSEVTGARGLRVLGAIYTA
ncbi:MAG: anhydro-N-acetylmuramic acid kinase [Lysobacteraceae bacterium]